MADTVTAIFHAYSTYFAPSNLCAYDFKGPGGPVTPVQSIIDGQTYPVNLAATADYCRAALVKELSDQQVTMAVSTFPSLATTELAWGYENNVIIAAPSSGEASTCYGNCPDPTHPYTPATTPTSAPTDSYIPPPTHPLTQFTPAPTCLANLWLVSTSCKLVKTNIQSPPWLACTLTELGEPDVGETACYQRWGGQDRVSGNNSTSFLSGCPVGYTVAKTRATKPYDYGAGANTIFDIVATTISCCPSGGGYNFTAIESSALQTSITVHAGETFTVEWYPLPHCAASRVSENKDATATMSVVTTTAVWDVEHDTAFAQVQEITYTDCYNHFKYSYHSTNPNAPSLPTATTTSENEGLAAT
ncbi:hypothetical protein B0H67DRAFT_599683 [Lasiosphaeris hirsuta]|uniref:Uncharacterized protein n=1 Tax=Lasiosphaeris hirsuta TaxID=260670 RepID=A0AA40AQD9_9PEZI|nr:hypothetical protein B0H67DRAFT_599683 [Lasiosphaeris hirsuta]